MATEQDLPSLSDAAHCWVCPHCGMPLPDYPLNSYHWEHCDPRPPRRQRGLCMDLFDEPSNTYERDDT